MRWEGKGLWREKGIWIILQSSDSLTFSSLLVCNCRLNSRCFDILVSYNTSKRKCHWVENWLEKWWMASTVSCIVYNCTILTLSFYSFGLPTRSRQVSEFMTGLEKTKAKAGEVSVSARALSLSDMHNLYDLCFRPNATAAEMRWGIVRYVSAHLH